MVTIYLYLSTCIERLVYEGYGFLAWRWSRRRLRLGRRLWWDARRTPHEARYAALDRAQIARGGSAARLRHPEGARRARLGRRSGFGLPAAQHARGRGPHCGT